LSDEIIEIKEKIVSKLPEIGRKLGQIEGRKYIISLLFPSSTVN